MDSAASSAWTRRTGGDFLLKRNSNLSVDRQGENNAAVRVRVGMMHQRFHYPIGAVVDFVAQLLVAFDNVGAQLLGHIRQSFDILEQAPQVEYDPAADNGQRDKNT